MRPTAFAVSPPIPASISSKTIVSPPPTAAIASATRESSPPEAVSATGANGRPGFGRIRNEASSAPDGPGSRSRSSARNSPSPMPTPRSSSATAAWNGPRASLRAARSSAARRSVFASAAASSSAAARAGVVAGLDRLELAPGLRGAREQLLVARAAEAAFGVGDPVEARLDLLEAAGLGLERGEEGPEAARRLAQAQLGVAQLVAGALELRRDPLERRDRPLGGAGEACGPFAVVGRERLGGRLGGGRELGDVPEPLPLGAQALLGVRLEPLGGRGERGELLEPRGGGCCVAGELVVAAAGGGELAPRDARLAPAAPLLLAAEGVEHVELVGRPAEAALLELARHRDQPLGRGGEVLARDAAAPRVGARAPVREHAAREHEALLAVGPQLGERLEALLVEHPVGHVQLGLDVGLAGARADVEASPLAPSRSPIACARIVFPAPVSPVIAFSPGPSSSSASRMSTRFSIRSRRSTREMVVPAAGPGHWLQGAPAGRRV